MEFPTQIDEIKKRIATIDPERYARTRNFADGAVTYLSPYVSRGVISTREIFEHIQSLGLPFEKTEKFIQELVWRDYWQQVWMAKGNGIHTDLKNPQQNVISRLIPKAVLIGKTGINVVDEALGQLKKTGYMHNHMRMYVASICCNIAGSHWSTPAKWMYAQLLDGDLASNHLSWQWVAGAFSNKKYYANQANINTFFHSEQKDTFLDIPYTDFDRLEPPNFLHEGVDFDVVTVLPVGEKPTLKSYKTTLIYNYYNLDPVWHKEEDYQRILLLEPSVFKQYPVEQKCIQFVLKLVENIPNIQVYVGEFEELATEIDVEKIVFKEHPLNTHYRGRQEPRPWLSSVSGYFPSFFAYWKKVKKEIVIH